MARVLWIVIALLLSVARPIAQPPGVPPITPDTLRQVGLIRTVASPLPGEIDFGWARPTIGIATSRGAVIYDTNQPEAPLRELPDAGPDIEFEPEVGVESGGVIWAASEFEYQYEFQDRPARQFQEGTDRFTHVRLEGDQYVVYTRDKVIRTGMPYAPLKIVFSSGYYASRVAFAFPSPEHFGLHFQLWDFENETLLAEFDHYLEIVHTLKFSADESLLITASTTSAIYGAFFEYTQFYDAKTGENVTPGGEWFSLPAVDAYGRWVAGTMQYSKPMIWSADSGWERLPCARDEWWQFVFIDSVHGSADRKYLFGLDSSGQGFLWEIADGDVKQDCIELLAVGKDVCYSSQPARFSRDARWLSVTTDETTLVWDLSKDTPSLHMEIPANCGFPTFSMDSQRVLVQTANTEVSALELESGRVITTFPRGAKVDDEGSRYAYWQEGNVVVGSLIDGTTLTIPVIETSYGRLVAVDRDKAVGVFDSDRVFDLVTGEELDAEFSRETLVQFRDVCGPAEVTRVTVRYHTGDDFSYYSGCPVVESPDGRFTALVRIWAQYIGQVILAGPEPTKVWTWETNYSGSDAAAFSPDGKYLATDHNDNPVALWPTEFDGDQPDFPMILLRSNVLGPSSADSIAFSLDSRIVVAEVRSNWYSPPDIYVWNVPTVPPGADEPLIVDTPLLVIEGTERAVLSPTGTQVAIKRWGLPEVEVWDIESNEVILRFAGEGIGAFSPDGSVFASTDADDLYLWNVRQPGPITDRTIEDVVRRVRSLEFSSDGAYLFARFGDGVSTFGVTGEPAPASADKETPANDAPVIDASNAAELALNSSIPPLDDRRLTGITFTPDSARVLVSGGKATGDLYSTAISEWDVASGGLIREISHSLGAYALTWIPGTQLLAVMSEDSGGEASWPVASILDYPTGQIRGYGTNRYFIGQELSVSPDGARVVTSWQDYDYDRANVTIWGVDQLRTSGGLLPTQALYDAEAVDMLGVAAYHPDGRLMIATSSGLVVLNENYALEPIMPADWQWAHHIAISEDGAILTVTVVPPTRDRASTADEMPVRIDIVRMSDLRVISIVTELSNSVSTALNGDGSLLAVGDHSGIVEVYSTETAARLAVLNHPDRGVEDVAFSPDGTTLAVLAGGTVWFWQVED
ncbi:MAG: WD40 repeat domain-containing protein [Chloroflexi bacterium]|nr:WD40 repeat domain-containing protein [Chloroflexota bacterium]